MVIWPFIRIHRSLFTPPPPFAPSLSLSFLFPPLFLPDSFLRTFLYSLSRSAGNAYSCASFAVLTLSFTHSSSSFSSSSHAASLRGRFSGFLLLFSFVLFLSLFPLLKEGVFGGYLPLSLSVSTFILLGARDDKRRRRQKCCPSRKRRGNFNASAVPAIHCLCFSQRRAGPSTGAGWYSRLQ